MKRLLSGVLVVAAQAASAGMPSAASAADAWAGRYAARSGSYRWEATITNQARGLYRVQVSVASRLPLCSGDVSVSAKLVGGKLLANDEDCKLTVTKDGQLHIRIREDQCSTEHGVACLFDSRLTRR